AGAVRQSGGGQHDRLACRLWGRGVRARARAPHCFRRLLRPSYDFAVSEPFPLGVGICAQVPLATYFQALPWKSTVEVPAQVVPAPAAQSLSPLGAMPQHLSMSARAGLGPANAGAATITRAAANEPASVTAVIGDFTFMTFVLSGCHRI